MGWGGWQYIRTGRIKSETIKIRQLLESQSQQRSHQMDRYWYDLGYYNGWYARDANKGEISGPSGDGDKD